MAKKLEVNYDRQIFQQLEETIIKVEKQKKEMAEMKAAHRRELYQANENHEKLRVSQKGEIRELKVIIKEQRVEIEGLRSKDTIKLIEELESEKTELKQKYAKEISQLKETHAKTIKEIKETHKVEIRKLREKIQGEAEFTRLSEENQALRGIIAKNSGNSSKRASSDGFKKIANSRIKSGKKAGGQFGHKGHKPVFYETPTQIIEMKKEKCSCGGNIAYSEAYTKKQLVDIEIKTNVTEYREYAGDCVCCGCAVKNQAPLTASITYGSKVKSLSSMLSVEGNISINRLRQILSEVSGGLLKLSEGTICKWNKDVSKRLTPSIQKIKEKLLVSPVLHKDETGVWVKGKLNWLHVLSNDKYTLYYSEKRRGKDADIEAGVLPAYKGVLVQRLIFEVCK